MTVHLGGKLVSLFLGNVALKTAGECHIYLMAVVRHLVVLLLTSPILFMEDIQISLFNHEGISVSQRFFIHETHTLPV